MYTRPGTRYAGRASALLLVGLLLVSCSEAPTQVFTFTRFAMDTVVDYTIVAQSHTTALEAVDAAHREIERIERLVSEFDEGSEIYALNHADSSVRVSAETAGLLERALDYSRRTGGAFDITVKPLLDLYGFGTDSPRVPSAAGLNRARGLVDASLMKVDSTLVTKPFPGMQVAVGGIAKGYAVDRAVAVLRAHGITGAIVNAGGDLYCLGTNRGKPWRVGVRHPGDADSLLAVVEVVDRAVATSGDYERFFESGGRRYHHILDPGTGLPSRALHSTTVVAESAEEADAFATAVFVQGEERGLETARTEAFQALVYDPAGTLSRTSYFPATDDR